MGLLSPEEIGELIKTWRREARLSQQALESLTGVGQKTLSLMERGQSMTLENVWAVLRYYGKGPEALTNDPPRNAIEPPRTRPEEQEAQIPLSEHRAALRAMRLEIEALERALSARPVGGATLDQIRTLGPVAEQEATRAPNEPGSAGSKARPRSRTRRPR